MHTCTSLIWLPIHTNIYTEWFWKMQPQSAHIVHQHGTVPTYTLPLGWQNLVTTLAFSYGYYMYIHSILVADSVLTYHTYPYENAKVVARLCQTGSKVVFQGCHKLKVVTRLSQPSHKLLNRISHLATCLSQPCYKLVNRLSASCLQPGAHMLTTTTVQSDDNVNELKFETDHAGS